MPVSAKKLTARYDSLSEEQRKAEDAKALDRLKRSAQHLLDQLAELAKEGKGLEWSEETGSLVICGTPGLNTRYQEAEAPEQPAKRTRGKRKPATPIVANGSQAAHLRADIFQQAIMSVLRCPDEYEYHPDIGIAEAKRKMGTRKNGQLISTIHPLKGEGESSVYKALAAMGDGCFDTYAAVSLLAYKENGSENITRPFLVDLGDILELCGKQKSNGSYTVESRLERLAHLKAISQHSIIATMPGYRKSTFFRAEGRLLTLDGKVGEYKVKTGETVWEKYSVALGQYITMVPELNNQTALVLRQLLAYSGKNKRYHKRLGYYLTFMFRNNAHKGGTFECTMKALLEGADIKPDRRVGEFRDAIERALADIQRDSIVGSYACIVDSTPEVEQHATGWWDTYARMKWRFEPPQFVKEQYRKLLKEGNLP